MQLLHPVVELSHPGVQLLHPGVQPLHPGVQPMRPGPVGTKVQQRKQSDMDFYVSEIATPFTTGQAHLLVRPYLSPTC